MTNDFPSRPCLEIHRAEVVLYDQDGVKVKAFDFGDGSVAFYASLNGQSLARASSYQPGGFHSVRTHPRLGCPPEVLDAMRAAALAYKRRPV